MAWSAFSWAAVRSVWRCRPRWPAPAARELVEPPAQRSGVWGSSAPASATDRNHGQTGQGGANEYLPTGRGCDEFPRERVGYGPDPLPPSVVTDRRRQDGVRHLV